MIVKSQCPIILFVIRGLRELNSRLPLVWDASKVLRSSRYQCVFVFDLEGFVVPELAENLVFGRLEECYDQYIYTSSWCINTQTDATKRRPGNKMVCMMYCCNANLNLGRMYIFRCVY